jgi:hypothetical protein
MKFKCDFNCAKCTKSEKREDKLFCRILGESVDEIQSQLADAEYYSETASNTHFREEGDIVEASNEADVINATENMQKTIIKDWDKY